MTQPPISLLSWSPAFYRAKTTCVPIDLVQMATGQPWHPHDSPSQDSSQGETYQLWTSNVSVTQNKTLRTTKAVSKLLPVSTEPLVEVQGASRVIAIIFCWFVKVSNTYNWIPCSMLLQQLSSNYFKWEERQERRGEADSVWSINVNSWYQWQSQREKYGATGGLTWGMGQNENCVKLPDPTRSTLGRDGSNIFSHSLC